MIALLAFVLAVFYVGMMYDFILRFDDILDLSIGFIGIATIFWPITWPALYLSQLYRRRNSKCKITKISNSCYLVWRKNDLGKWEFVHDLPSLKEAIDFAKTKGPDGRVIWYL